MSATKVITLWYRKDDNNVYHINHLEEGYDSKRTGPTPKVPEQTKMWKNGKWGMQRAELVIRGMGVPDLVTNKGDLELI